LVEKVVEGGQKTAAGTVLNQQRLHFKGRGVQQIVQRGVLIDVLAIDIHASPDQFVGDFFVRHQDLVLCAVARTKDGPVQGRSSLLIRCLYVSALVQHFLRPAPGFQESVVP
jgi:hypothetical protein